MKGLLKFAVLGAVMLLLVLTNMYMLARPVNITAISDGTGGAKRLPGQEETGDQAGTDHIQELTFVQTFSRPLFSIDRRKYEPPKPKPPPPQKTVNAPKPAPVVNPPELRLIGVSIDGTSARALIAGGPDPNPVWVAEGEAIEGWVLAKVLEGAITVTQAGAEFSIDLYPENR